MELDIMMYLNPNELLPCLEKYSMAYAYHRPDHCNSGIFFTRDLANLERLLTTMDNYLRKDGNFEMFALHEHYLATPGIGMFPLCPTPCDEHPLFWKNYEDFEGILFDGAILSILYFLFAYNAIQGNKQSWIFLLFDVFIGFISSMIIVSIFKILNITSLCVQIIICLQTLFFCIFSYKVEKIIKAYISMNS
jgi:hypothetical protein